MENISSAVTEPILRNIYTLLRDSSLSFPSSVSSLLENYIEDRSSTARSGCNDPFAIFGFLAFLLVLLQLLANNNGRRRKRSEENCYNQESDQVREAMLAVHLVFQGFLNSLSEGELSCKQRALCEGCAEASGLGMVGGIVARVSSLNAPGWLDLGPRSGQLLDRAGERGLVVPSSHCRLLYPCHASKLPEHYKFPSFPEDLSKWQKNLFELQSYF